MKKFRLQFRQEVVAHYYQMNSQQQTADFFGISRRTVRSWIAAYQRGGLAALQHPQSKKMFSSNRPNPFIVDKPDHQKTQAELIEELQYMRAENACIKEWQKLKSQNKQATRKKQK